MRQTEISDRNGQKEIGQKKKETGHEERNSIATWCRKSKR